MKLLEFLTLMYGFVDGQLWLVTWTKSGSVVPFSVAELEKAAYYIEERSRVGDIYYGIGLQNVQPQNGSRGAAKSVGALPGFWLDIDVAGGEHAKEANKLPTIEQAHDIIKDAPWKPSCIVNTGGGMHVYWLFNELWMLDSEEKNQAAQDLSRRFQQSFIRFGRDKGFHVDNTSSLAQVLRLPGALNHKYAPPVKVTVEFVDENCRYSVEEIKAGLPVETESVKTVYTVHRGQNKSDHSEDGNFPLANLELIEKHCPFMGHCRDNSSTLAEPEWFAQASIICRCEDGDKLYHERSTGHPGYNSEEAQAKLEQARKYGPRTCDSIRSDLSFSGCEKCLFAKFFKSPVNLGNDSPLVQAKIKVASAVVATVDDPGAIFTEEVLEAFILLSDSDFAYMERIREDLKKLGVRVKRLDEAIAKKRGELKAAGNTYFIKNNALYMQRMTNAGLVENQLGNFSCVIAEEVTRDDGAEKSKQFLVKGAHESGESLPAAEVPVAQFKNLEWTLEKYGCRAVIFPGCLDHFRAAIQVVSTDVVQRDLYCHTGWRKFGDKMAFLHGGGALGSKGGIENIEVDLGEGGLENFRLEIPESNAELQEAIKCSLKVLELAPLEISAPLLAVTYLAPLGEVSQSNFSLFIEGETGAGKSEIAAIAQSHFGRDFNGKNLPANWTSTENSLEKLTFIAKDAVVVIDDFNPTGTQADVAIFHRKAERLFRGQGNQAGRQRMRPDGSLRPTYFSRGMLIGTGEDIPKGHSLRARVFFCKIEPRDVNFQVLDGLQEMRDNGMLAKAMGGFIQWLAPQFDKLADTMSDRKAALRKDSLEAGKAHARTPDIITSLVFGMELLLEFAMASGVISEDKAHHLWANCRKAIHEAARRQVSIQQEECPAQRFMELLSSAIAGRRAYLEDIKGGIPKVAPEIYGWHGVASTLNCVSGEYQPKGKFIGWVDDTNIYLDPNVAFAVVQALANSQSHPITIGEKTMRKRLADKGLIADADKGLNTKRISTESGRRRVLVISRDTLHSGIMSQSSTTGQGTGTSQGTEGGQPHE